jgi:hypothetical protein
MTALEPGTWIRLANPAKPAAPLAVWRQLADVLPQPYGWLVGLVFTDGLAVPWHRDNLDLFEVSHIDPHV